MHRINLTNVVLLSLLACCTAEPARSQSGVQHSFTKDGEALTADRWLSFTVDLNTLQIGTENKAARMGDMQGDAMLGSEGGSGGYGMGGMGMGGYSGGEMVDPDARRAAAASKRSTTVHAFVFDSEVTESGRTRIEVLTRRPKPKNARMGGMGMGGEGGMDMGGMGEGGMGMGGMGMGMGGMSEMGMSNNYGHGEFTTLENYLASVRPSKKSADAASLDVWNKKAAELIRSSVQLVIWKGDAIRSLKSEESSREQADATETLLRELLGEEYDSQLTRQQFELTSLQDRLKQLETEIKRRRQAKDRVVDVQLGKLVLEAQGIIGEGISRY